MGEYLQRKPWWKQHQFGYPRFPLVYHNFPFFNYHVFRISTIFRQTHLAVFARIEPNYLGSTIVISVKGLTHSRLINAITIRPVLSKAGAMLPNKIVFTKRDNANMMDIHWRLQMTSMMIHDDDDDVDDDACFQNTGRIAVFSGHGVEE